MKNTNTKTKVNIFRCGECGSYVPRDRACIDHPDASLDPDVVTKTQYKKERRSHLRLAHNTKVAAQIAEHVQGGLTPEQSAAYNAALNNGQVVEPDELFVYSKTFSRGYEDVQKFRIKTADVRRAFEMREELKNEKDEDARDAIRERFYDDMKERYGDSVFGQHYLCREIYDPTFDDDPETFPQEFKLCFGIFGEEAEFGVAPTKQGAKLEFVNIPRPSEDDDTDDENW